MYISCSSLIGFSPSFLVSSVFSSLCFPHIQKSCQILFSLDIHCCWSIPYSSRPHSFPPIALWNETNLKENRERVKREFKIMKLIMFAEKHILLTRDDRSWWMVWYRLRDHPYRLVVESQQNKVCFYSNRLKVWFLSDVVFAETSYSC